MWGRGRNHHDPDVDAVLAEAEALLTGRLAATDAADDRATSSWAWVNCLAHASVDDLVGLAEPRRPAHPAGWAGAVSYLAHEVLTAGRTAEGVVAIQRAALVPLELDLLAGVTPTPATPGQLVTMVRALVERHQREHRSQQHP